MNSIVRNNKNNQLTNGRYYMDHDGFMLGRFQKHRFYVMGVLSFWEITTMQCIFQARCQRDLEKLAVELERQEEGHRAALAAVERADEEVQAVKEDVKRLDDQILALKKIREIKLHSSTVKKIFHYGYTPGEMTEYTGWLIISFCSPINSIFRPFKIHK
jgi:hypothetical protein